jgi:hypothetical protein
MKKQIRERLTASRRREGVSVKNKYIIIYFDLYDVVKKQYGEKRKNDKFFTYVKKVDEKQ